MNIITNVFIEHRIKRHMDQEEVSQEQAFVWKTKNGEVFITSLQGLLDTLVNIHTENIDEEINHNINKEEHHFLSWIEEHFPKQLELIADLKNIQEYTPQQTREMLVRNLRKIIKV
jgi:hypothetical protein